MSPAHLLIATLLALLFTASAQAGPTLEAVRGKGFLRCGVSEGLPGFSEADAQGNYRGLDVDVCRAVAAAVFGDAGKVRFVALTARERFTALQLGEVDLLSRNTTWTSSRDSVQGFNFTGITYYDGQGFMVSRASAIASPLGLEGKRICVQSNTTTELNLQDYFRANDMEYTPVTFERSADSVRALETGRCAALTSDQSQLYAQRTRMKRPEDFVVLPEIISKEPLGPLVRHGDDEWFDIVKWSLFAMVLAEELGITSRNVDQQLLHSSNPDARRLLGLEGDKGRDLGLSNDWAVNIIRLVGNYGESFERNVGRDSPLQISRGYNALWTRGGLQYAPPVR